MKVLLPFCRSDYDSKKIGLAAVYNSCLSLCMSEQIKEAEAKAAIEEEKRRQQVSTFLFPHLLPPHFVLVSKSFNLHVAEDV